MQMAMEQQRTPQSQIQSQVPPQSIEFDELLCRAEDCFVFRRLSPGQILWREGDVGEMLALILAGKVVCRRAAGDIGHPFILSLLGAGAILGESGLLDSLRRQETVEVREPTLLATISKSGFNRLRRGNPDLAAGLLQLVLKQTCHRLQGSISRMAKLF